MWRPSNLCRLSRPSHRPQGQGVWGLALSSSCHSCRSQGRMRLCRLVSSSRRRWKELECTAASPLVYSSHRRRLSLEQLGLLPPASSSRMAGLCSQPQAQAWLVWARHPSSHRPVSSNQSLIEKQTER